MSLTAAQIHETKAKITAPEAFFELEDISLDGRIYKTFKHAPKTLIEVLNNSRGHGAIDFMVYEGRRYSFDRFYAEVDAMAAVLQSRYGIVKGDRVAIAMRNNPEWAISYAAITYVGAIVVPINSWGKTEELQYAVTDSRAKLLVADVSRLKLLDSVFDQLNIEAIVVDTDGPVATTNVTRFEDVLSEGEGKPYQIPEQLPEDSCVILYTSGSTGFPKGVVQRHIGVCQALMNMMFAGFLTMDIEGGAREYKGGAERETPLLTVPLFHATGLLGGFLIPLQLGQKAVMMYKWDSEAALKLVEEEKITSMTSVPAIIQDLLNHPSIDNYNLESLIRVSAAGAATPPDLPAMIDVRFNKPSRSTGYAMTETMAVCSTMIGAIFDFKPDSSGVVSPIIDIRFVDPAGNVLLQGEAGEIQLRGITCTPGYWEKPEANDKTFHEGGWMETGDVGMIDDDGFIHITGRIKEIVIRGGENIYPGEIEGIAYQMDGVQENVVFGVPDDTMGEEMVLVAYPTPGHEMTADGLRDYLKGRLASYKVPKFIEISDSPLPRNASEKLHKLKVKEQYLG